MCSSDLDAQQHMARAFTAKELEPISHVNRAAVELENGQTKEALADATTAISKDPWLKEAYAMRADIRQKLNDNAGAADDKNKAEKLISHLDI